MLSELWEILFGTKKKKYSDGVRDQRIQIRVSEEEKEIIEKLAKINHLNTSNFIRWLIFKKYIDDFIK